MILLYVGWGHLEQQSLQTSSEDVDRILETPIAQGDADQRNVPSLPRRQRR